MAVTTFDLRENLKEMRKVLAIRSHSKGLELQRVHHRVPTLLVGDPA
jgi:hypothetical protein